MLPAFRFFTGQKNRSKKERLLSKYAIQNQQGLAHHTTQIGIVSDTASSQTPKWDKIMALLHVLELYRQIYSTFLRYKSVVLLSIIQIYE